jgi:hypothetical protein
MFEGEQDNEQLGNVDSRRKSKSDLALGQCESWGLTFSLGGREEGTSQERNLVTSN